MEQVLRGSARTTEAAHRGIQNSQESLRALAKYYGTEEYYGTDRKTLAK
jgi:hypothetical protein